MEVSGQLHAPAALPPGKESPVPITETQLHHVYDVLYYFYHPVSEFRLFQ
jgi:hypothetical protein